MRGHPVAVTTQSRSPASIGKKLNSFSLPSQDSNVTVLSELRGLLRFIVLGDGHLDNLPFLELVPHRKIIHDRDLFLLPG